MGPEAVESVERAIERVRTGGIVIMVDDEDRENEGDFVMAAEDATAKQINFMAVHGRGLICVPMEGHDLDRLEMPMMVRHNTSPHSTAMTVAVDAAYGITTGISSADRAHTIRLLSEPEASSENFVQPGHVFPLRYQEGGVLVRAGHTEGSIDLVRAAGKRSAAVVCEIMNDDGTMARRPQLEKIAKKHDIPIVSIADIIAYRLSRESFVQRVTETRLPTKWGEFRCVAYRSNVDPAEHIALVMGKIDPEEPAVVRVHSECLTGDIFGSQRCDCGEQLDAAMSQIADAGVGALVYMRQEGRGIGLINKLKAYRLQDNGLDTVEANNRLGLQTDLRHYGVGAQILLDLGIRKFKFLTNNPKKVAGLEGFGLEMVEQVPLSLAANDHNRKYLETKRDRMMHQIKVEDGKEEPSGPVASRRRTRLGG
ncbi:MAG: bifunctional 3,4-dihydroxy-2-butanone-4-phosphate synthase/GTP cyclohydrolase II [Chloroflexi bacterium]|nr:bifunctional 3,4-dihydroxy-2-butanone-4-phosphate synthase/GTP cyclohydrolase II [Chloroflexota bacterium]